MVSVIETRSLPLHLGEPVFTVELLQRRHVMLGFIPEFGVQWQDGYFVIFRDNSRTDH